MLKTSVTSLLICAALLVANGPSKAFAQTLAQGAPAGGGPSSGDAQTKQKPGLRTALAEATARTKAGASLEANLKMIERAGLNARPQAGYTKKDKIIVYSIVAGLVVLAVVLALTIKKGGHTFCSDDPGDPDCLPG